MGEKLGTGLVSKNVLSLINVNECSLSCIQHYFSQLKPFDRALLHLLQPNFLQQVAAADCLQDCCPQLYSAHRLCTNLDISLLSCGSSISLSLGRFTRAPFNSPNLKLQFSSLILCERRSRRFWEGGRVLESEPRLVIWRTVLNLLT